MSKTRMVDRTGSSPAGVDANTTSRFPYEAPARGKPSRWKRPAVMGYGALGLIVLVLATRHFFFVPVHCDALVRPGELAPGEQREAVVTLQLISRAGSAVPGTAPRFRCIVDEGGQLTERRYANDSTRVYLRPLTEEGDVVMRLVTSAWPFPVYAIFSIRYPRA